MFVLNLIAISLFSVVFAFPAHAQAPCTELSRVGSLRLTPGVWTDIGDRLIADRSFVDLHGVYGFHVTCRVQKQGDPQDTVLYTIDLVDGGYARVDNPTRGDILRVSCTVDLAGGRVGVSLRQNSKECGI